MAPPHPTTAYARVAAYDWLGSYALKPLGFALAGLAAARIGATNTVWIGAGWTILSAVAALAIPDVRHLTTSTKRDHNQPPGPHRKRRRSSQQ
jgi:hypothetical protein